MKIWKLLVLGVITLLFILLLNKILGLNLYYSGFFGNFLFVVVLVTFAVDERYDDQAYIKRYLIHSSKKISKLARIGVSVVVSAILYLLYMFITEKILNELMTSKHASDFVKPSIIMVFVVGFISCIIATVIIEFISWLCFGKKKK